MAPFTHINGIPAADIISSTRISWTPDQVKTMARFASAHKVSKGITRPEVMPLLKELGIFGYSEMLNDILADKMVRKLCNALRDHWTFVRQYKENGKHVAVWPSFTQSWEHPEWDGNTSPPNDAATKASETEPEDDSDPEADFDPGRKVKHLEQPAADTKAFPDTAKSHGKYLEEDDFDPGPQPSKSIRAPPKTALKVGRQSLTIKDGSTVESVEALEERLVKEEGFLQRFQWAVDLAYKHGLEKGSEVGKSGLDQISNAKFLFELMMDRQEIQERIQGLKQELDRAREVTNAKP